jgi:hypothetical protein
MRAFWLGFRAGLLWPAIVVFGAVALAWLAASIVATGGYFAAGRLFFWFWDGRRQLLDEARRG